MPLEPPATGGYAVAAYIVAAVILLCYGFGLWRRARKAVGSGREQAGEDS